MNNALSIITVGISPSWDVTAYGKNLRWGEHQQISGQTFTAAGKALNVSKALAWLGCESIAAGLWGDSDYEQMKRELNSLYPLITTQMTIIPGRTRWNITIVDTDSSREMHLRSKSDLAGAAACAKLADDLQRLVTKDGICVFSGSLPDSCALDDLIRPIRTCHNAGAKIVLDSSGPALKKIVDTGLVWLIKPNVLELGELIEEHIDNNDSKIARAAKKLLEKTEVVLISRGSSGATVVTRRATFKGICNKRKKVSSTVGCGDYLLAGFLNGIYNGSQLDQALKLAIKTATAKAWGWSECHKWKQIEQDVEVEVRKIR